MKAYFKPHPRTKKKFMQNVGGRKKYLASTYPEKKNSRGIKGLKKKFMPIPNHPTPHSLQKLNGWPLSLSLYNFVSGVCLGGGL